MNWKKIGVCLFVILAISLMVNYGLSSIMKSYDYNNTIIVVEGDTTYLLVYKSDGVTLFSGFNWTLTAGDEITERLWLFNNRTATTLRIWWTSTGLPTCYVLSLETPHYEYVKWSSGSTSVRDVEAQLWLAVDVKIIANGNPIPCTWKLIFNAESL